MFWANVATNVACYTYNPMYHMDSADTRLPQICDGVFLYEPDGQRWKLGISTPEQRAAAWKYGHHSLILMDGTFNVSDKRVLLFIVMVVDENWKGTCATCVYLVLC